MTSAETTPVDGPSSPAPPDPDEEFLAGLRPNEPAARRRAFSALLRSVVTGRD
jgi:hypothetical protein